MTKTLRFASIVLAGGALVAIPADAGAQAASDAQKAKRKRVKTDMSGFELLSAEKLQKQTTVAGATRSGLKPPPPVPIAPYLGKALAAQPTFSWASKAKEFTFVLQEEGGGELQRKTLSDLGYRYADGPALQPGKTYTWTVQSSSSVPSAAASFRLLDEQERKPVEAALALARGAGYDVELKRARVLAGHRIWYDAVAAYSDLIARYPDKPEPLEERGAIYDQLPQTRALAEEDYANADALSKRVSP